MKQVEYMAQKIRPLGARSAPKKSWYARFRIVVAVALLGYVGAISGVSAPGMVSGPEQLLSTTFATLSYSDTDPVITGSVQTLFQSASFVGPNRALKTDRLRPDVDILDMAGIFLEERTRLAALNPRLVDPALARQSFVVSRPDASRVDGAPRISLAAVDPALASAALEAIDRATPLDPSVPRPTIIPEQLAYVRANTPATERATNTYSERERWCMATAIYFEARGESYRGQVGVAQVVMNRVKHRLYPDTICGVVFQNQTWRNRCQFSFACDGIPERVNEPKAWAQAREITEKVTNGTLYLAEVNNATHYHANYVYPAWAPRMTRVTRIGAHIFYRFRRS